MALVIPSGFCEIAIIHQHNSTLQRAVCTFGLDTDVVEVMENVGDAWEDNMLAEMNSVWTMVGMAARVALGTVFTKAYATPGAGSGNGLSPQVCYLIRKTTADPGRRGRGRFYLPGCDEESVDNAGRVSSGKLGGLSDELGNFEAALAGIGGGHSMYVLHNDEVIGPSEVTSLMAELSVATQRRRLAR